MNHYVCPSCGSISEAPKACETVGCNLVGTDMIGCNCEDGLHGEVMNERS